MEEKKSHIANQGLYDKIAMELKMRYAVLKKTFTERERNDRLAI